MSKRAERRHHLRRMKAKAKKVLKWCPERSHIFANHLKSCSCHMCCNPRHSYFCKGANERTTRQEQLSVIKLKEFIDGC